MTKYGSKNLAGFHTEAISPVAISPRKKAIYRLWNIALLQYERSRTNESVLFVSDILLGDIATSDIVSV